MKLGTETGSMVNHLISACGTPPEEGKGATELLWSDRKAYEVLLVSPDKKTAYIQAYVKKRIDKNGLSENQEYLYDQLEGPIKELVYRKNNWYVKTEIIEFTSEYNSIISQAPKEEQDKLIADCFCSHTIIYVPGKTRKVSKYNKINIIFGVKEFYQDPTF